MLLNLAIVSNVVVCLATSICEVVYVKLWAELTGISFEFSQHIKVDYFIYYFR